MKPASFYPWLLILSFILQKSALPVFGTDPAPGKGGAEDRITQLQIFLDDARFGPGKIDGRWGEFTALALNRYRIAHGMPAGESTESAPADFGVDLGDRPVFTEYQVTEEDLSALGDIPEEDYAAQEKLDSMPYERLTELLGERFHCDEDYVQELNPGLKWETVTAGTAVKVPNVTRPFYVKDVKSPAQVKKDAKTKEKDSMEDATDVAAKEEEPETEASKAEKTVRVDVGTKMLDVLEGGKLVASFPITPGSDATPAPVGEWKVKGTAYMPDFRRDESMLKTGVRSQEAHLIPPGPNNAVGVVWIALIKDGIGIHGTHDPDAIGRNASHGCIRLANWDIVELAKLVKAGEKVAIQ